jgi:hypothetical protein
MGKLTKLCLTSAVVLVAPSLSWANAIFTLGNNPQPTEQNVLLNKGSTGTTVTGNTNLSGTQVDFTSTQVLNEPANGQARLEATFSGNQVALTNISFNLGGITFADAIFNMAIVGTIGTSGGTATITAFGSFGSSVFDMTLGNGSNFLTVTTTPGDVLTEISISYATGFTDLGQVRISGIPDTGSTLGLLALGLATLFGASRLRSLRAV